MISDYAGQEGPAAEFWQPDSPEFGNTAATHRGLATPVIPRSAKSAMKRCRRGCRSPT
jgi:hypothetical protein